MKDKLTDEDIDNLDKLLEKCNNTQLTIVVRNCMDILYERFWKKSKK